MEILTQFGIDGRLLLVNTVNFLALTLLLSIFLYKPVLKMLEQRREMIKKAIDDAKAVEVEREDMKKEYRKVLHEANDEAKKIVQKAIDQSSLIAKQINEDAQSHAEMILVRAKQDIESERKAMFDDLKGNISVVVKTALSQVLQESLTDDEQNKLLTKALQDIKL